MAGEKENKPFFSVEVKPVTLANNINKYNEQTPSLDYSPKDPVYDAINKYDKRKEKSDYQKKIEERNRIAESFGIDPRIGPTYTPRDESKFGGELLKSPFPGVKDRYITTKERISGITDPSSLAKYGKESGFTVTPTKFNMGDVKGTAFQIGVQFDKNRYGLTPAKVLGEDIGGMYNFKDPKYGESTKAFVAGMMQNEANAMQTEVRLKKEQEERKEQAKIDAANERFDKISKDFLNDPEFKNRIYQKTTETESPAKEETSTVDKVFGFLDALGKVERVGPQLDPTKKYKYVDANGIVRNIDSSVTAEDTRKLGTMPSMGISEAGREEAKLNRLQKAKEEGENKNIFQKVGDAVGNVFNKLTGTEAAGAGTLQGQGINTSATTNISQMGNVSPTVQRAREAVEKSVIRQTGMPSNPKGFSGYSRPSSTSTGRGISKSTSRGQGGRPGSRSRGGTGTGRAGQGSKSSARGARGSAGSRSRGGTGSGRTSTSRSASKASKGRTGRGRSQCDIRTKIDISPLINFNLVKDNLAEVAYFVQEIRK